MAEHRALRLARRAAREHDLGERVRGDDRRRRWLRTPGLVRQRLDQTTGRPSSRAGTSRSAGRRGRVARRSGRRSCARTRPGGARRAARRRRRGGRTPKKADAPLRPVDRPQDHAVALAHAGVAEDGGGPGHDPAEVPVPPGRGCGRTAGSGARAAGRTGRHRAGPGPRGSPGSHASPSVSLLVAAQRDLATSCASSSRAVPSRGAKCPNTIVSTSSDASRDIEPRASAASSL